MLNFLHLLFSSIFAHVNVRSSAPRSAYHEGDNSPWVMTDNGPILPG